MLFMYFNRALFGRFFMNEDTDTKSCKSNSGYVLLNVRATDPDVRYCLVSDVFAQCASN